MSYTLPSRWDDLWLRIDWQDGGVVAVDLLAAAPPLPPPSVAVATLFAAYFAGDFAALAQIPFIERGTPFQQRVWQRLRQIAAGDRVSYAELAQSLATSPRAIAAACRANSLALITPCHRVVARNGLGGYMGAVAGAPMMWKSRLLQHEQR
jgi:methylated-DNA-[protein]-cysteine S-methyltransferase